MPITTTRFESDDLTIHAASGDLSFDEAFREIEAYYKQKKPTRNVLWNLNQVSALNFTSEEIEKIASYEPRFEDIRPSGKTAIVANEDLSFGISRMFELYSQMKQAPHDVRVFRELEQAMEWLELNLTSTQ